MPDPRAAAHRARQIAGQTSIEVPSARKRRRTHEARAQQAHFTRLSLADNPPQAIDITADTPGFKQQRRPGSRQPDRTIVALEQQRTQVRLKPFDALCEWQLRDVQPNRSTSEMQILRQHHEISQTAQFHVSGRPARHIGVIIVKKMFFSGE